MSKNEIEGKVNLVITPDAIAITRTFEEAVAIIIEAQEGGKPAIISTGYSSEKPKPLTRF